MFLTIQCGFQFELNFLLNEIAQKSKAHNAVLGHFKISSFVTHHTPHYALACQLTTHHGKNNLQAMSAPPHVLLLILSSFRIW